MLLKRRGDGGLARGRQASEPNRVSLLLSELITLAAGQSSVPGDVAVEYGRNISISRS